MEFMQIENNFREDDLDIKVSICCATYNHEKFETNVFQVENE